MKNRLLICLSALCLTLGGGPVQAEGFDVAITVDDLPAQGDLPEGVTELDLTEAYIRALKAHQVPEAYGFVNAAKLERLTGGARVLDQWVAAGFPLGNHGYTHMNLGRAPSLEAWIADIKANEPAIASRMAGKNWHVIRMPNLSGGGHGERHDGAVNWLKASHYRIAEVSLNFSDWAYTAPYNRCLAKGDTAAIARMEAYYLHQVDREIRLTQARSQKVYGRVIPQVLLTHLGSFAAHMLPQVLERLEAAGARFVTLEAVQSDPAYMQEPDTDIGNGTLIERVAKRKAIDLKAIDANEDTGPVLDLDTLCQ